MSWELRSYTNHLGCFVHHRTASSRAPLKLTGSKHSACELCWISTDVWSVKKMCYICSNVPSQSQSQQKDDICNHQTWNTLNKHVNSKKMTWRSLLSITNQMFFQQVSLEMRHAPRDAIHTALKMSCQQKADILFFALYSMIHLKINSTFQCCKQYYIVYGQ